MRRPRGLVLVSGGALAVAGLVRLLRWRPRAQAMPGVLRVLDGDVVHYVDRGEGPAIIFLHGFGGSTFSWRYALDSFAATHRVIALDFPGFGWSERDATRDLGHEAHALRVVRLMDALGVDAATLVGHSMGGAIAQRLAARYPERVDGLLLVNSETAAERRPWERAVRRLRGLRFAGPALERTPVAAHPALRIALRRMVADPACVTDEMVDGYCDGLTRPGTSRCMARMAARALAEEPIDLGTIRAPTLVVSGAMDRVVPPTVGEGIAASIPGARHVVLPSVGHMAPEEQPEAFHLVLDGFLEGRAAS